jgi:uncharacterized membrane protein YedE/YeeE
MTFPLMPSPELGLVFAVVSGFGFGFVLERAGFGRAQKLVGQFYGHDMSVFKVMFTAVVTAMLVIVVAAAAGLADFRGIAESATSETLLVPFAVGGAVVGAGFVMSGYCPGTSWVAMASGKLDGLFTVLGTVVGAVLWSEVEFRPGFATLHNATNVGHLSGCPIASGRPSSPWPSSSWRSPASSWPSGWSGSSPTAPTTWPGRSRAGGRAASSLPASPPPHSPASPGWRSRWARRRPRDR